MSIDRMERIYGEIGIILIGSVMLYFVLLVLGVL